MILFSDGSTHSNGKFGFQKSHIVVVDEENNLLLEKFVGDKTIVEAEALGLIAAFNFIDENSWKSSKIYSDCQFWINVLNGKCTTRIPRLIPLEAELKRLQAKTGAKYDWVSRSKNLAGLYFERREKIKEYFKHDNINKMIKKELSKMREKHVEMQIIRSRINRLTSIASKIEI